MSTKPKQTTCSTTVIVGAGPQLGAALAQKFGKGGGAVALVSRSEEKNSALARQLNEKGIVCHGFACDTSSAEAVKRTFTTIRESVGEPATLIYNAGWYLRSNFLEIGASDFVSAWKTNCYGAFLTAQECLPGMLKHGGGTILFTGATASIRGSAQFAGLTVGKAGLRALAQSLAREYGPKGIHVCHVVIDGKIGADSSRLAEAPAKQLDPNDIAQSYWHVAKQPPSAWTLEMDLRPAGEKF